MMTKTKLYLLMLFIFFGPLFLFVAATYLLLPQKAAVMIIGLVGFVMIVAGPFWAMGLERRLRDKYMSKPKQGLDSEKLRQFLAEDEE